MVAFEKESEHRRQIESLIVNAEIEDRQTYRKIEKSGQTFAFWIAVLGIIAGVVIIALGHLVAGTILSGGTIATLTALFIYGRERRVASAKTAPQQGSPSGETLPQATGEPNQ